MSALSSSCPPAAARAQICVLGPLRAWRADGSVVESREWRTGKTMDLVRLLALRAGQPVPGRILMAALWPSSELPRAQASLRTAASQIRRTLGHDCLQRSIAGLSLNDVWVDAVLFQALAAEVHTLLGLGLAARANECARQADALYCEDLRAHDEAADWAVTERDRLAVIHQELLVDAADAALHDGSFALAVDYSTRALQVNPFSERACRALMRAHAELGETSQALCSFERIRTVLAEELGADPSPETRAAHLTILQGRPFTPDAAAAPLVGTSARLVG